MPVWLGALAMASTQPTSGQRDGAAEGTDWAALLAGVPEGQRHDIAARIAGHYLGLKIAPVEVEQIVLGYAERCVPLFRR